MKLQVYEALGRWIIDVTNKKTATPEEIAALPKVAEVFFGNQSLFPDLSRRINP